jgi:hypothetical protein
MWLFLWILFVLAIFVAIAWSYHVIFEQKRAWGSFAKKYNLEFAKGTFFQPPSASGLIKGRQVNLYSQQRVNPENATQTTTSVLEVFLNKQPTIYAAVGSPGFIDFMTALDLPAPFLVDHPQWPNGFMSRTLDDEPASTWFLANPKRIEAMAELSKIPFDVAFVMNDSNSFVVARTSHPLSDPKRINQIMGKLFAVVGMIEEEVVLPSTSNQEQIANPNGDNDKTPSSNDDSKP